MAKCLKEQNLKLYKQQLHILTSDLNFFEEEAKNICSQVAYDEQNIRYLTEQKTQIENEISSMQQLCQPLIEKQKLERNKIEQNTSRKRKRDNDEDNLCNLQAMKRNLECKHQTLFIEIRMLMRSHLAKITQKQYILAELQKAKKNVCECKANIIKCEAETKT